MFWAPEAYGSLAFWLEVQPYPQIEKKMSLTSINGKIFQWKYNHIIYIKDMRKVWMKFVQQF
jgi:hypothetical protein